MDSCPPATMMPASPLAICCMPMATVRRPEPQSWLSAQAVFSCGTPADMAAWRAGFWPWPAVRIWPRITSSTSPPSTLARSSAALMAMAPSSWAGVLAKAPLNEPTVHITGDNVYVVLEEELHQLYAIVDQRQPLDIETVAAPVMR